MSVSRRVPCVYRNCSASELKAPYLGLRGHSGGWRCLPLARHVIRLTSPYHVISAPAMDGCSACENSETPTLRCRCNWCRCCRRRWGGRSAEIPIRWGLPRQAVRKRADPQHRSLCLSTAGACPHARSKRPWSGWVREAVDTSCSGGPVRDVSPPEKRNFRCKFLFSGAFSVRKLTHAKVKNTTHFHSRLYYVQPARRNTEQLASRPGLRRDAEQRCQKTGCLCKNGTDDNPGFGVNQQFWILKPHYIFVITVFRCSWARDHCTVYVSDKLYRFIWRL